ncbi:MAG: thioredoxin domain-containing protein [Patescibacteria group bacterium]
MNKTVVIIIIVLVVGAGVFFLTRSSSTPQPSIPQTTTSTDSSPSAETKGEVLAGKTSLLYNFTRAKYDEAYVSDKLVVLYFYANWCPECKKEIPELYTAFNELTTDKVIGFRISYNDNETDDDEVSLAKEFGVAYQHTKVFIKNGQRILKSPETWEKQRYLDEIQKAI